MLPLHTHQKQQSRTQLTICLAIIHIYPSISQLQALLTLISIRDQVSIYFIMHIIKAKCDSSMMLCLTPVSNYNMVSQYN